MLPILFLTVIPMPVMLSRIEREYVVKNLEESLPEISLLCGINLLSILEKTYSITSGIVSMDAECIKNEACKEIRVYFFHKKRGMYFDAVVRTKGAAILFAIPDDIYLEELKTDSGLNEILHLHIGKMKCKAVQIETLPLDAVLINPRILNMKKTVLDKISRRSGLKDSDPFAVYRLYEYLDSFGKASPTGFSVKDGNLIFVDHQFILASVHAIKELESIHDIEIMLKCRNRTICTVASIFGSIPVTSDLTVLCLDIAAAQEEDKRFLYERLYKKKYH